MGFIFLKYMFSDEYESDDYEEDMDDCDTCSDSLQGSDVDLYADDGDVVIPGSHGGQMSTGMLLDFILLRKPCYSDTDFEA